jgi:hypothetical protein
MRNFFVPSRNGIFNLLLNHDERGQFFFRGDEENQQKNSNKKKD